MSTVPFPWNPFGFIPDSVAHLFTTPKDRKIGPPPPPPGPKSQICIGKPATLQAIVNTAPNFNTPIATQAESQRTRKVRGRGLK